MRSKRSKNIKTKTKLKRAQKRVVNKRRINKRSKRKTKKRLKQRGGAEPEMEPSATDSPIPTAGEVKARLREWKEPHCVPYKVGSVMFLERSNTSCDDTPFPHLSIDRMEKGVIYQYIMYKIDTSSPPKLLLVPAYQSPEIGTKHRCLIERINDDFLILGSGEIVKVAESTYAYSCMSSLFNYFILPLLRPKKVEENPLSYKRAVGIWKEAYESETMKKYMESIFVGSTVSYAKDISGVKKPFNPEILCATRPKPSCIRYVTEEDCSTQLDHPHRKIDCRAGEDFCDLLERSKSGEDVFNSPKAYEIPEIEYIKEKVVKVDDAKELLQSIGIDLTKRRAGGSIQGRLRRALKASKITQDEYDSVFEEKRIWPKNV